MLYPHHFNQSHSRTIEFHSIFLIVMSAFSFSSFRFDTVSRSHRFLVSEFERQQTRLMQLLHWYDHQRIARGIAMTRQCEKMQRETLRQINKRSTMGIRERTRLQHFLDDHSREIDPLDASKSLYSSSTQPLNPINDRKRQVYGCLLPQFKAPLTSSSENWSNLKSSATSSQMIDKKPLRSQRTPLKKYILSPIEQRKRMNRILYKCEQQFEQCEGHGYEHSLPRTESNKTAQILVQQT